MVKLEMDLFEKLRLESRDNACPACGHVHVALPSMRTKAYKLGFFGIKESFQVDVLTCEECGHEWESNAYPTMKSLEKNMKRNGSEGGWKKAVTSFHKFIANS